MKIVHLFTTFSLLLIITSCTSNGFKLKGSITGMPEQKFYLEELGSTKMILIDSGKTNTNGSFSINGIAVEPTMYRIRFAMGKYIMFVGDKQTINVAGEWDNLEEYKIQGNAPSTTLKTFLTELREYTRNINSMDYVTKNVSAKGLNKDSLMAGIQRDINAFNKNFSKYVKSFADTTTSVPNAVFAANFLVPEKEATFLKDFYNKLEKRFPGSAMASTFAKVGSAKFANIDTSPAQATFEKKDNGTYYVRPADAKPATPFEGTTPGGNKIALSSYKGKFVLVDFWASWCGPCRAENPNVLAAYRQYKDKNFDILGVSLDDKKDAWEQAIKADGLAWQHISELTKWNSIIARDYGVNEIPSNFLIDPDGYIIAKNLKGTALTQKLESLLNSK